MVIGDSSIEIVCDRIYIETSRGDTGITTKTSDGLLTEKNNFHLSGTANIVDIYYDSRISVRRL